MLSVLGEAPNINDKHIEVIVRQMMRWVKIEETSWRGAGDPAIKNDEPPPPTPEELPRWTSQNRQLIDTARPAINRASRDREFYCEIASGRKSVWTLVRQLRGPHLSTWA